MSLVHHSLDYCSGELVDWTLGFMKCQLLDRFSGGGCRHLVYSSGPEVPRDQELDEEINGRLWVSCHDCFTKR